MPKLYILLSIIKKRRISEILDDEENVRFQVTHPHALLCWRKFQENGKKLKAIVYT